MDDNNEILIIPQTLNNNLLNSILMSLFLSQYSRKLLINHFHKKNNKLFTIFDLILNKLNKPCKLYDIYSIKTLHYLFYQNKIISKIEFEKGKYNLIKIMKKLIKFMNMKVIILHKYFTKQPKYSPDYIICPIHECKDKIINYNNNTYILDSCIIENFIFDDNDNDNDNENSIVGITSNDIKYLFNGWLIKPDKIDNDLVKVKIKKDIHSESTLVKFDWSNENNMDFCLNISLALMEDENNDTCLSFHKIHRTFIYVKVN